MQKRLVQAAIEILKSVGFRSARLDGYTLQEGWLSVIRPYPVRRELPLQVACVCRPLPHVIGPTVSEYYEAIRLLDNHRALSCL